MRSFIEPTPAPSPATPVVGPAPPAKQKPLPPAAWGAGGLLAGVLLVGLAWGVQSGKIHWPSVVSAKASAVTYVFEKDDTGPPSPVRAALSKLNLERNIVATELEVDTTNGLGEVPTQYKVTVTAAHEAGLPSLVVQAGEKVLKVVKNPTTGEQVLGVVP